MQRFDADTESHIVGIGARELADGDTDHLVLLVDDRASGVSGVHRGIGLDVVLTVHQLRGRRDGSLGDGEGHAVGIAGHPDLVADGQRIIFGQIQHRKLREIVVDGQ